MSMRVTPAEVMAIPQLAKLFGVTPSWFSTRAKNGEVKAYRASESARGKWFIYTSSIIALLNDSRNFSKKVDKEYLKGNFLNIHQMLDMICVKDDKPNYSKMLNLIRTGKIPAVQLGKSYRVREADANWSTIRDIFSVEIAAHEALTEEPEVELEEPPFQPQIDIKLIASLSEASQLAQTVAELALELDDKISNIKKEAGISDIPTYEELLRKHLNKD